MLLLCTFHKRLKYFNIVFYNSSDCYLKIALAVFSNLMTILVDFNYKQIVAHFSKSE